MPVSDVGQGATLVFGGTAYAARFTEISEEGETVPVIDTTHLGTTGTETAMFGDLKTRARFRVTMHHDPSITIPLGVSQTVTLTHPVPSGLTNGATVAGTGGIAEHSHSINKDLMTATMTVEFLGAVTRVAAS